MTAAGPPAPRAALEAAARIRVVHEQLRRVSHLAEAQLMEAAWTIRGEIPERAAFDAFVAEHAPVLDPGRAWLMADTWAVARRSRKLKELAYSDAPAALDFVRQFVEAGEREGIEAVDELDADAVALLAQPAARRHEGLRKLLSVSRDVEASADPHRARMERLERERDEAVDALERGAPVESLSMHPAKRLKAAAADLQAIESQLAPLAEAVEALCRGDGASEAVRQRLLATGDLALGHVERITAAAMGGDEAQ